MVPWGVFGAHWRSLNLAGGSGSEEKPFNAGCILNIGPMGCADKLDRVLRERNQGLPQSL